ncbi:HAD family hydrolase [Sediminibacillus albus]|uniref:Cof subfamily of IIB subfamily of haloacid dehalogenase superfamily/HAD-superfamily hydrolase, subfamily IIB n=1 Tax=Sediminibacillus albus TaxID=407036 RepID=A0A1G8ZU67_9BACI|nr:HAD family hydrolase [Sediminibacillus albus]SDK18672.1 hypothetical protein SAMN05216243_2230 [Sediminibacillus albus]
MTFQAKAVILDMDGTMLNHVNEVSENLKNYVKILRKQGRLVFIATGRTLKEVNDAVPADLKVDGMVCANGMVIYAEGEQIIKHMLDGGLVKELVEKARKANIYYEVHSNDSPGAALQEDKGYFEEQIEEPKPDTVKEDEWRSRQAALEQDVEWKARLPWDCAIKIYFFSRDKHQISRWKQTLDQIKKQNDFSTFSSSDHNVEVMEKNISKATGMQYLLEKFSLSSQDVMMVGDSENDLPLMEIAGYAVAMKNAPSNVKEKVDEITAYSYKEDGLYRFLKEKFGE